MVHTKIIENINVWKRTEAGAGAGALKKESYGSGATFMKTKSSGAGVGAMFMKRRSAIFRTPPQPRANRQNNISARDDGLLRVVKKRIKTFEHG